MSSSRATALKNKNILGIINNPRPTDPAGTSSFTSFPWTKRKLSQLKAHCIDTYSGAFKDSVPFKELPTESFPVFPFELPDEGIGYLEHLEDVVDILAARISDEEQGEDIPYSELRKKLGFTDKWPTE